MPVDYVVYFESANYCGAGEYCIVRAETVEEATVLASAYAEDYYYEEDGLQYVEDNGESNLVGVIWATIVSIDLLEDSSVRDFVYMDEQQQFYPRIN